MECNAFILPSPNEQANRLAEHMKSNMSNEVYSRVCRKFAITIRNISEVAATHPQRLILLSELLEVGIDLVSSKGFSLKTFGDGEPTNETERLDETPMAEWIYFNLLDQTVRILATVKDQGPAVSEPICLSLRQIIRDAKIIGVLDDKSPFRKLINRRQTAPARRAKKETTDPSWQLAALREAVKEARANNPNVSAREIFTALKDSMKRSFNRNNQRTVERRLEAILGRE